MSQVRYSINGEEFIFDDPCELLNELERIDMLEVGAHYYAALCEHVRPVAFDVAADILELLYDKTYLQAGDAADVDDASVSKAGKDELNALVNAWAIEHVDIAHYWKPIEALVTLEVTADDVELHTGQSPFALEDEYDDDDDDDDDDDRDRDQRGVEAALLGNPFELARPASGSPEHIGAHH